MGLVDWKRVLFLLPLLAAVGVILFFLLQRNDVAGTPAASLAETPGTGADVGTTKGKLARDFIAYSPQGDPVRLSDLRGTPTIINFWATWCASCAAELPDLRDLQEEAGPNGVRVVAVNVGEGAGRAREFLAGIDAEALLGAMDPTLVIADAYGVRGMPQSVFIDRDGIIRAVYVGQLKPDIMREYLASATRGTDRPNDELGPLRFITTVARDHVLEVREPGNGLAEFASKSLRCDDAYCAAPAVDEVAAGAGVRTVERYLNEDPARLVVAYDAGQTDISRLTRLVRDALERHPDPLYTRPLEVVFR